jgi:hypothetical protein
MLCVFNKDFEVHQDFGHAWIRIFCVCTGMINMQQPCSLSIGQWFQKFVSVRSQGFTNRSEQQSMTVTIQWQHNPWNQRQETTWWFCFGDIRTGRQKDRGRCWFAGNWNVGRVSKFKSKATQDIWKLCTNAQKLWTGMNHAPEYVFNSDTCFFRSKRISIYRKAGRNRRETVCVPNRTSKLG